MAVNIVPDARLRLMIISFKFNYKMLDHEHMIFILMKMKRALQCAVDNISSFN